MKTQKHLLLVTIFAFLSFVSSAQFNIESRKNVYSNPNLKNFISTQKSVAIVPFKATISYKHIPKNYNIEENAMEEKRLGQNMQLGMFTYLLGKSEKYSVSFQDVERTNALLKQAGIFEKIDDILPDSLCKLLKVDAVIRCNYSYEKKGSEGGAIVSAVLLGGLSSTGSGGLTMQINDKVNGDLIWRFYKEMNETIGSNANEVMERMMRKVSRNFPYEK